MPSAPRSSGEQRILDQVQEQYTRFPWPPLESASGYPLFASLDYVRYVLWPERSSLDGIRVLDAGCGTGLTAVVIARDFPEVQVTGVDLSAASIDLARERASRAGAPPNLEFRAGSIEDLPDTEHFDYIISSGVLHHLASPLAGAKRLAALLAPAGGMGIMVYGTYGRYAVYLLQDLLRRLGGAASLEDRARMARHLLAQLPPTHPFRAARWDEQLWHDDAEIVELLLRARDRSYTVSQLRELLTESGLRVERFYAPHAYQPERYVESAELAAQFAAMPEEEKPVLAELLHGAMSQHLVFATLQGRRPLRFPGHGTVLLHMRPRRMPLFDWNALVEAESLPHEGDVEAMLEVPHWAFPVPKRVVRFPAWARPLLERANGEQSALQLFEHEEVRRTVPGADSDAKLAIYLRLLELMAREELVLFEP